MSEITLPTGHPPAPAAGAAGDAKGLPIAVEPGADLALAGAFELLLAVQLGLLPEGAALPRGPGPAAVTDAPDDAAAVDAAALQAAAIDSAEIGGARAEERIELLVASPADPALALANLTAAMALGHSAPKPVAPADPAPLETDDPEPPRPHTGARHRVPVEADGVEPHAMTAAAAQSPSRTPVDAPPAAPGAATPAPVALRGEERLRATEPDPSASRIQPALARADAALLPPASTLVGDKPATVHVATPVHAPGWRQEMAARVTYLVSERVQAASLQVNPPELGPVEVRVRIANAEATLSFVASHPQVREAIESALPRLREMLADAGITLGSCHVGADGRGARPQTFAAAVAAGEPATPSGPTEGGARVTHAARGLVDVFV